MALHVFEAELEARLAAGAIGTRNLATVIHRLWKNLTQPAVAEVFGLCPWLDGIPDVCSLLDAAELPQVRSKGCG